MNIILLPGLDGTGKLFYPFIEKLPKKYKVLIIEYPNTKKLTYDELIMLVKKQLPKKKSIL